MQQNLYSLAEICRLFCAAINFIIAQSRRIFKEDMRIASVRPFGIFPGLRG